MKPRTPSLMPSHYFLMPKNLSSQVLLVPRAPGQKTRAKPLPVSVQSLTNIILDFVIGLYKSLGMRSYGLLLTASLMLYYCILGIPPDNMSDQSPRSSTPFVPLGCVHQPILIFILRLMYKWTHSTWPQLVFKIQTGSWHMMTLWSTIKLTRPSLAPAVTHNPLGCTWGLLMCFHCQSLTYNPCDNHLSP